MVSTSICGRRLMAALHGHRSGRFFQREAAVNYGLDLARRHELRQCAEVVCIELRRVTEDLLFFSRLLTPPYSAAGAQDS